MFDPVAIRKDFPIFKKKYNNLPLVYLDSTATALKPNKVIQALNNYYENYSANVFRGIYAISEQATQAYEQARQKVAEFIGVSNSDEIIFTRNTSESINLIAYSWGFKNIGHGDRVVTTIMEHHSNFVPWQQIAKINQSDFAIWKINEEGSLNIDDLEKIINRKTKLLALTALSNVLGTINPIAKISKAVKRINPKCRILVDAAQWIPHMTTDIKSWNVDFVAFSGHKMLGPTGIGVLWAKRELLSDMDPFLYGGEMISEVHENISIFKNPPHKYEAGTPHIAGAIGLSAAVEYLKKFGMKNIRDHEIEITTYALNKLSNISGLTVYGPKDPKLRGGVIAFAIDGVHPHDISQVLADRNICIRAGHHCAMPLHEFLNLPGTARASFYLYSTTHDVDMLIEAIIDIKSKFLL